MSPQSLGFRVSGLGFRAHPKPLQREFSIGGLRNTLEPWTCEAVGHVTLWASPKVRFRV